MKMIRAARVRLLLVPILAVWAMNSNAEFDLHLFGLVDAGVDVGRSGKGTTARQISGGDAGSRWGMDGTEDLGQGLSATFRLVGGFGADDGTLGQGGRLFGREAAVGLAKKEVGTLLLGRQPTPVSLTNANVDAFYWMGGGGFIALTRSGATTQQVLPQVVTARVDNAIKYYSPEEWKTVAFTALFAPGERSAELGDVYGLSARYLDGPFDLNAAWGKQNSGTGASGAINSFTIGGSYNAGFAKFYAGFTDEKNACSTCTGTLARAGGVTGTSASDFRLANLGVRIPIGKFSAIAQIVRVNDHSSYKVDPGNRNATWIAIGGEYSFSRRTLMYGSLGTIDNRNGSQYALGSGGVQRPANSVGPGNPRSTTATLGIKHVF